MPGGLCGCGAFGVLAGGCPLWLVGDGFVVVALVLGFRGIWVWACGLGSREGTRILSCLSVLTILSSLFHYFSDRFCLWRTFLIRGGCRSSSFHTSLFSWARAGTWV